MSGKFSPRGHKSSNSKIIGGGLVLAVLFSLGGLYFLQPKPPVVKEVTQEVTLAVNDGSYVPPAYSANSALPSLPQGGADTAAK